MADLTDLQAAGSTKIVGSDNTGLEQTAVQSTSAGGLHVNLRNNAGTELATTANPAIVAGPGVAGTPAGGVLSIQGVAGGTAVPTAASNFPTTVDTNYGTVGASTLRVAAQIGNATGAALFGAGTTTAQVLRVVLPTDQSAIPVTQSGTWTVVANEDKNFGTVGANTLRTAAQLGNATGAADFNYGTVGAQTVRNAAQIGNATGAADFNAGATGAQTLRTVANQGAPNTAANAWFTKTTDGVDTQLVTTNGDAKVVDGLRNGGVYGALNIPTANTPVEAKVGVSRLANRKFLQIVIQNTNIWYGLDSSVTTTSGTPTSNGQVIQFAIDPDSTFQIWLVGNANNKNVQITECP